MQNIPSIIQMARGSHSPWIALLIATIFFFGLGQLYNRQHDKFRYIAFGSFIFFGLFVRQPFALLIYLVTIADAFLVAKRLNRGEPVHVGQWF